MIEPSRSPLGLRELKRQVPAFRVHHRRRSPLGLRELKHQWRGRASAHVPVTARLSCVN